MNNTIPLTIHVVNPYNVKVINNPHNVDTYVAIVNLLEEYDEETNTFILKDGSELEVGKIYNVKIAYEDSYYEYVDDMVSHEIPGSEYFIQ